MSPEQGDNPIYNVLYMSVGKNGTGKKAQEKMAQEKKAQRKNVTGKKWHKVHDRKKWHNFISIISIIQAIFFC